MEVTLRNFVFIIPISSFNFPWAVWSPLMCGPIGLVCERLESSTVVSCKLAAWGSGGGNQSKKLEAHQLREGDCDAAPTPGWSLRAPRQLQGHGSQSQGQQGYLIPRGQSQHKHTPVPEGRARKGVVLPPSFLLWHSCIQPDAYSPCRWLLSSQHWEHFTDTPRSCDLPIM